MNFESKECDVIPSTRPRDSVRVDPVTSGIEIIFSNENVRVMKMFDIAATPERGRVVIRVDIFE